MIIQTFSTTVMSVLWLPHYMILQFFLTNQEYREKYPEIPLVDIQSAVERPYLYILGQSTSSDLDQRSYLYLYKTGRSSISAISYQS